MSSSSARHAADLMMASLAARAPSEHMIVLLERAGAETTLATQSMPLASTGHRFSDARAVIAVFREPIFQAVRQSARRHG